jgi:Xaa-Pro aminopeptidase
MEASGLDALIMLQNADLFYFTGTIQAGSLYLPVSGAPLYLVRQDYLRARMECGLAQVLSCPSLSDLPGMVEAFGHPRPLTVGLELDVLPVNIYRQYRLLYPKARFLDASALIRRVRMLKSHYEIHILQDAADQADKVYSLASQVIREGMSELELVAELERLSRLAGHAGRVRTRAFNGEPPVGAVLSGREGAAPGSGQAPLCGMGLTPAYGFGASYNRIGRDEPIVVDFASSFDGYLVQQTRIFALGSLSPRMRRGYADMLQIEELMLELAPGRPSWGSIWDACWEKARDLGYADHFMGGAGSSRFAVGHGVGIELDEYPSLAHGFDQERLQPGMVFAFEPKLVFPGEGAIGLGDTFYLTEVGVKRLTYSSLEPVLL